MEAEFPNASQLHVQTRNYENDLICKDKTTYLTRLLGLIQENSKKGKYELCAYVSDYAKKFLIDKGYTVTKDMTCSTISWK